MLGAVGVPEVRTKHRIPIPLLRCSKKDTLMQESCVASWILSEVQLSMVNLCVPQCPLPAHSGASMEF